MDAANQSWRHVNVQFTTQYRPDTLPFRLITPSALQLSRVSWADIALLTFAGAF